MVVYYNGVFDFVVFIDLDVYNDDLYNFVYICGIVGYCLVVLVNLVVG